MQIDPAQQRRLAANLIEWFDRHARDLPWRRARTPYRVWLAEVMLQQTRVETAIPYYERFLARFPTLEALAAASLQDVLRAWEGLGYYARARNLHAAARRVMEQHGGRLPETLTALRALPGVGPYIAGAVASIAFGQPAVALDGNGSRVLSRLFCVAGDPRRPATRRQLTGLAQALLPADRPGAFNEALIELGAMVCTPRATRCDDCPLSADCLALQQGQVAAFPERMARRPTPHYDVTAAVTVRDGLVLVAQRALDDFLGGLWEFPGGKREAGESLEACLAREMREELDIEVEVGQELLHVDHAHTHFRITLYAFLCTLRRGEPRCIECADARWVAPQELDRLPLSVVNRRIARAVQAHISGGKRNDERT